MRVPKFVSITATLVTLTAIGASAAYADERAGVQALTLIGPDGGASLLIGSMHTADSRLIQPSDAILDGADRLVVESLPNDMARRKSPADLLDPAVLLDLQRTGKVTEAPWAAGITSDELAVLRERLQCISPGENGDTTVSYMLSMRPRYAAVTAALPCSQPGTESRDSIVLQAAARWNLRIIPLETSAESDEQLQGMSDQTYVNMIHAELSPAYEQVIGQVIAAMNRGEWDEAAYLETSFGTTSAEPSSWHERIVVERNALWMPRLLTALKGGGAVVMVGAGHIGGPDGLITLLRDDGFEVAPTTLPARSN